MLWRSSREFNLKVTLILYISLSCTGNDVRLFNGYNESEGQLSMCVNGEFHAVCSAGFDVNDARVVCKDLGYHNTSKIVLPTAFKQVQ